MPVELNELAHRYTTIVPLNALSGLQQGVASDQEFYTFGAGADGPPALHNCASSGARRQLVAFGADAARPTTCHDLAIAGRSRECAPPGALYDLHGTVLVTSIVAVLRLAESPGRGDYPFFTLAMPALVERPLC